MKRIIAIVAGGDSSEHDVSMRSAQGIKSFLENQPYDTYIVEVHKIFPPLNLNTPSIFSVVLIANLAPSCLNPSCSKTNTLLLLKFI